MRPVPGIAALGATGCGAQAFGRRLGWAACGRASGGTTADSLVTSGHVARMNIVVGLLAGVVVALVVAVAVVVATPGATTIVPPKPTAVILPTDTPTPLPVVTPTPTLAPINPVAVDRAVRRPVGPGSASRSAGLRRSGPPMFARATRGAALPAARPSRGRRSRRWWRP